MLYAYVQPSWIASSLGDLRLNTFFEGVLFLSSRWAIYTIYFNVSKHSSDFGILIYCKCFPLRTFPSVILFWTLLNTKSLIETSEKED